MGNPVLEFATDFNSRAEYFWSHGLISDSTYGMFTSACNYSRYVSEYYRGSVSSVCSRVISQVSRETSKFVDKYDVTLDVCISSVMSQSKFISPQQVNATVDVCVEDKTVRYLNRKDVQKALRAKLVGIHRWDVCSSGDQDSVIPLTGAAGWSMGWLKCWICTKLFLTEFGLQGSRLVDGHKSTVIS